MKKYYGMAAMAACMLFAAALVLGPGPARPSPKSGEEGYPIPDSIMKIVQGSCMTCHTGKGNEMALAGIDLSKWEKYSPKKQVAKAADMCQMVSNGKMPPQNYRDTHPDELPTAGDIKTICNWAKSIQPLKN